MPACRSLFAEGIDTDDDRATLSEEDLQAEEDAQIEAATLATTPARIATAFAREQQLLDEMTEVAEAGPRPARRPGPQAGRLDSAEHVPGPAAARNDADPRPAGQVERPRVIIFTEYDDTKRYLQQQLTAAIDHDRPSRRAHRRLSRPDAAGRARGNQAGLQRRSEDSIRSAS